MKNLIIKMLMLSAFSFSQLYSFGSVPDPAVAYAHVNPSPILRPTGVSVSLTVVNLGAATKSDDVSIHVSLSGLRPPVSFDLGKNISGEGSELFNWIYDLETNSFIGTLNSEWSFARRGSVQISNLECTALSMPGKESVGLNVIVIAPDEINARKTNDNVNAYTSSSVVVSSRLKEGAPAPDVREAGVSGGDEFTTFFPNPVKQWLGIRNAGEGEIQVLNTKGELMYKAEYIGKQGVDMSSLSAGIYVIKITDRNGRIQIKKVLKE
jgi:hypothetical protein